MVEKIKQAIKVLQQGGIILYPTEGVWGLGCDPFNETAVRRVLKMKKRDIGKGLILIAANWRQVKELIKTDLTKCSAIKNKQPITWIFPATKKVPLWIKGRFNSVAIRVTIHPLAKRICQKFGRAIVSTSANPTQKKPIKSIKQIDKDIITRIDFVVSGRVGELGKETKICDVKSGKVIRR